MLRRRIRSSFEACLKMKGGVGGARILILLVPLALLASPHIAESQEEPLTNAKGGVDYMPLAPYECQWFTRVMRNCTRKLLSMKGFQHVFSALSKKRADEDLMMCAAKNAAKIPDRIYCTEKESVSVLSGCLKLTLKKFNSGDKKNNNFVNEFTNCLASNHQKKLVEMNKS
ncbi:uncharacterized protein LOC144100231 [Amblyomma americanum]